MGGTDGDRSGLSGNNADGADWFPGSDPVPFLEGPDRGGRSSLERQRERLWLTAANPHYSPLKKDQQYIFDTFGAFPSRIRRERRW